MTPPIVIIAAIHNIIPINITIIIIDEKPNVDEDCVIIMLKGISVEETELNLLFEEIIPVTSPLLSSEVTSIIVCVENVEELTEVTEVVLGIIFISVAIEDVVARTVVEVGKELLPKE